MAQCYQRMASPHMEEEAKATTRGLAAVTAVILAGGLGTRLRPVVADRPKALADVRGRPFLAYLLDQIAAAGVEYIVLCIGHLGEQLRSTFGDAYNGLQLVYSRETMPLGTGGALRKALPLFRSDPVLIFNGDSYCDVDLTDFWQFHRLAGATGSLVLVEADDVRRYGHAFVQPDGVISGFAEKADGDGTGSVSAGIYIFSQRFLCSIPEDRPVSLEREVLPCWVGRGLYGYRSKGAFLDIGTPEAYAATGHFFASRRPT